MRAFNLEFWGQAIESTLVEGQYEDPQSETVLLGTTPYGQPRNTVAPRRFAQTARLGEISGD